MLIERFHVRERGLEFDLPGRIRFDRDAWFGLPRGVDLEQLVGDLRDGAAHSRLGSLPLTAAQERGRGVGWSHVGLHAVELVGRNQQSIPLGVTQVEIFAFASTKTFMHDAVESSNAAVDVDDEIAGLERLQQVRIGGLPSARSQWTTLTLPLEAENLGVADQREQPLAAGWMVELPALGDRCTPHRDRGRNRCSFGGERRQRQPEIGHQLRQTSLLQRDKYPSAGVRLASERLKQLGELAREPGGRAERQALVAAGESGE